MIDTTIIDELRGRIAQLEAMLKESQRDHGCDDEGDPCEKINYLDGLHECTCGADEWNARIDAVLNGVKR